MAQVRVRKRGKTFSYIFEAGKVDGKRKVVEKGGFPTKSAAYKAGMEAYVDFLHGNIGITSESITLADFMTNWLANVVTANVKPTTLQTYQSIMDNQILPNLGGYKVQELKPALLDKWVRDLLAGGFSRNTLRHAHDVLCHALDYAVYPAQLINSNPAAYIKVPKNAPKNLVKRTIIPPERFKALLEKYPFNTPYHIPLLLLYHTGMRISEVIGLAWEDIDFEKKTISVVRQLTYLHGKGYFFSTPKTPTSKRTITVDNFLMEQLAHWQEQIKQNQSIHGGSYVSIYCDKNNKFAQRSKLLGVIPDSNEVKLVCVREDGRAVKQYNIGNILKEEGLNSHSFRHTHATILIEHGASPKGVSGRLGHSNIYITQDLYTHITDKINEDTADIFTKIMQTNP